MIRLKSASLEAWIHPRGATLAGLWMKGNPRSLVLGFAAPKSYVDVPIFAGAIVGPVANRIDSGHVPIEGQIFRMPRDETGHTLHSGKDGLHALPWTVLKQSQSQVSLAVDLPDGATGLPGKRRIEACYALGDDGALDLFLTAISDTTTVMNLAHHPYWKLDGEPDVSFHTLRVPAQDYLPTRSDLIPLGPPHPVNGTEYDFRTARHVPVDCALDANLCVAGGRRQSPTEVARLTGRTGVQMMISSTEPGLQLYNGSGLPETRVTMHPGQRLAPFSGIALEPQGWPDAPNQPSYPSITLRETQMYKQHTRYQFSRNG